MRTVNDVIKYVNDIKPNAFTDETLTEWLSECEGSIQTEILCIASGDVVTYSYADNKDTELIVKPPHDKLYGFYLLAMIDFAHGEYKKYENTMQLFNAALSEFAKWFVRTHSKEAKNPEGYYMSGYDLAVKHGYSGTEEEWLKTLIGPQGVQGIQGEKGDRGIPGKIQSVTSGDNGKILVDGESVVVYDDSEIKEEIGGKVDKVQGKGLSTNDYTTEEKTKLSELPSKTELNTDLSGKEDSANKVTTLDSNATDTQYPSAKATYDELVKKLNADEAVGKKTEQGGEVFNVESGNRAYGKSSHAQGKRCCTGILAFPIKQIDTSNNRIILDYNDVSTVIDSFKADTGIKLSPSDIFLSSAIYYGCTDIDTATNSRTYYTLGSYPSIYYVNSEDICILTFSYLEKNINPSYIYMDVNSFGTVPILGENSSAEGFGVIALSANQHAQGVYNEKDFANRYAHIVGNGTSDSDRSNAHTLDWDGNAWYQGDIRVGGTSYDDGKTAETKTTTVKSTETTASITLADNTETRYGEITSLTVALPETISDSFVSSAVFKSGATATTVTVPSDIYCQGADCKNGAFLPKANKRYTMIFSYDGIMNCYIAAVPIQTAETQSADDFPAANDESVAEPTESVAEEPESEPNEVI